MNTVPHRSVNAPKRGFTLVEIMVVVVIIGFLAAMAIPAFQRVQRASKTARIVNDFRVFSQAFEIYNSQNGGWPPNATAGAVPAGMSGDFRVNVWQNTTVIGGSWNWDNNVAGLAAAISIQNFIADDNQLQEIDAKLDDGDLTTGNVIKVSSNRFSFILQH
jgi:type IV pilus assembly protein PilA